MPDTHRQPRTPPGPAERYTLNADPATLDLLERLTAEYGETLCVHSADRKDLSYVLHDPAHIRHVLVTNHGNYVKGVGFERVKMLLGNGIIVSDGEDWRRQRTMIQPGFSRTNIARLSAVMRDHVRELGTAWATRVGQELDLTAAMSAYGLEIILRTLFSEDLRRLEAQPGGNPFAFLAEDPTRDIRTVVRMRELGRLVEQLAAERRQTGARPFDFLSLLMDARDRRTDTPMTDRELVDEVKTLIVAGHETSAGTLNWAWYLLARNPAVAERLLGDLAGLPGPDFSLEDLMARQYLPAVLKETLRLYPPVWLFSRRAVADDRIGDFDVPAGTHIFISPYLVHRRPHLWPEPERFDPGRFAGNATEIPDRNPAFIPFSAGPRRCIGEYFSFVEMELHLAVLFPRYRMDWLGGGPDDPHPELDPAVNLRTRFPIMMKLDDRAGTSHPAILRK